MAAYLIADIELHDTVAYETYRQQVPAIIAKHGGKYLVRGGAVQSVEGGWQPQRMVVLEFPTMAQLQAFYNGPDYAPLKDLRISVSHSRIVLVEGL